MAKDWRVLTIGDVARICCVSPKTAQKWFDTGEISGHRLPHSNRRRITIEELLSFMKRNNMPLDFLEQYQSSHAAFRSNLVSTKIFEH